MWARWREAPPSELCYENSLVKNSFSKVAPLPPGTSTFLHPWDQLSRRFMPINVTRYSVHDIRSDLMQYSPCNYFCSLLKRSIPGYDNLALRAPDKSSDKKCILVYRQKVYINFHRLLILHRFLNQRKMRLDWHVKRHLNSDYYWINILV